MKNIENHFLSLIRKRRSIRLFQQQPVEAKKIALLKEALLRAPSSRNHKPWQFIFVDEAPLLEKISHAKEHGSAFVAGAPLAVVILADPEKSDVWVEDCAIAATMLQFNALDLGLGSCWVQIRKRKHDKALEAEAYLRKLLKVPETLRIASIIAMGYPGEEKTENKIDPREYKKISQNIFMDY